MMRVIVTCGISDRERVTGMQPRFNQKLKYEAVLFIATYLFKMYHILALFQFYTAPFLASAEIGFHVWCLNER
jgi:hypothetical protein